MLGYLRPPRRVDAESALPADEDTLGCFLGSWLVVAEFVSQHTRARSRPGQCTGVPFLEDRAVCAWVDVASELGSQKYARSLGSLRCASIEKSGLCGCMTVEGWRGGERKKETYNAHGWGRRTRETHMFSKNPTDTMILLS